MTDPPKSKSESSTTAQLKKFAKDITTFAYNATEEQRQTILRLLNQGQILELLEAWRGTDRRRVPRRPCTMTVQFGIEKEVLTEIIRDASTEGVFIESFAPLRVGQEITMTIWLVNEERSVEITGEVIWAGSKGVGVRFTTPPSEELRGVIESL